MSSISKIVVIGNDPRCGICNTFKKNVWNTDLFKAYTKASGIELVEANMGLARKTYDAWLKTLKLNTKDIRFPDVFVVDAANKVLWHTQRPTGTVKQFIAALDKACVDCEPGVNVPVVDTTTVVCTACKGTGRVAKKRR